MIHTAIIASTATTGFIYFLVLLGVAIVFLKINDWIFHRPRKKKGDAVSKSHDERLKNPAFAELERHFGCSFPPAIKVLYANHEEILRGEFDISSAKNGKVERSWHIAFYEPADLAHVIEAWPDAKEVFEFANDGCGNGYTIDPRQENPPVKFYDHETGEWETVANSIAEFVAIERKG